MHFTSSILLALAGSVSLVSAAPAVASSHHRKRAASDIVVFKFADVLEQLESAFYQQALAKFQEADFRAAGFADMKVPVEQFLTIQKDESTHSAVLQAALKSFGETPITSCKFKFDSVLGDVTTMAAVARVVENLGVMAYLGGATLLTDPVLLTAAGSILTVEARHQTVLNMLSGTGTAIPAAFDFALTPSEVLALAVGFLDGPCDLGIPANTPLTVTNTGSITPGTKLTFSAPTINGTIPESQLFCQMMVGEMFTSLPFPINDCVVPDNINGPVAIWITSDGQPLANNVRDRDQIKQVAGPTMAFIDSAPPQAIAALARGGSRNLEGTTVTTATISPASASAIAESAGVSIATIATTDAPAASPTPNSSSSGGALQSGPGPVLTTGVSKDGAITVEGWIM